MTRIGQFVVAPDHPCLPGHFPGHPIVPGVVLLDEALALIGTHLPGVRLESILAGKFLAAVRPGETVEVICPPPARHRLEFACTVAGAVVARGTIRLA